MVMIAFSGVIGAGKSTLTGLLSEHLNIPAYYEPVSDNPVLADYYKGNEIAEKNIKQGKPGHNPYAFLLQIYFLNQRFHFIKEAAKKDSGILDRSIYEDKIFMKLNYEQNKIKKTELDTYYDLFNNMMEELNKLDKKHPDLMIFVDTDYDTMIKHIKQRGRDYEQIEQDPSLVDYYKLLIKLYKEWIKEYKEQNISPVLVLNSKEYDIINNEQDKKKVFDTIDNKLRELGLMDNFEQLKLF